MIDILASLRLRRDSPIPPFMQLRSQFEYQIVTGHVPPGGRLPSVRAVGKRLGASPATVTKAYRELEAAGLIVPQQGSGYYVLSTDDSQAGPHARIRSLAASFLKDAAREGISADQALQILLAEIAEMRARSAHLELAVVCKKEGRRDELAMHLRHSLMDLKVEVTPYSLEDVVADLDGFLPSLKKARHVLCLAFDLKELHSLLADHGVVVTPILGAVREDIQDQILHLPAGTRVGVLASAPEFVDGMISAVLGLNPTVELVGGLSLEDSEEIRELLSSAEFVVHGTLARRALEAERPFVAEPVELVYVPEDGWSERFRRLVQREIGL